MQAEILFRMAADDSSALWQDSVVRAGGLFMVGDPTQSISRFRGADVGSYSEARSTFARLWPYNIIQITANFRSRPPILTPINPSVEAPMTGKGTTGYVPAVPPLHKKRNG